MQAEAVAAAKDADVAVLFVGLPDLIESEAFDRDDMKMPLNQNALIEAVTAVQPNTIIVLHNGSPIEMPWLSKVKGVLEAYLSGEAAGGAIVDILFGKVNGSSLPIWIWLVLYHICLQQFTIRQNRIKGYRYPDCFC